MSTALWLQNVGEGEFWADRAKKRGGLGVRWAGIIRIMVGFDLLMGGVL